jgi:putative holliday junction resolvase
MPTNKSVLALDMGGARVGVALASLAARLPSPLTTLNNDSGLFGELKKIIVEEDVCALVVGLPRGLDGQFTAQTAEAEAFADEVKRRFNMPVYLQDEALTSQKAEDELARRGEYKKSDIDALAAAFILEDWLGENKDLNEI